jgi:predicted PurR-regulated permease PerM
MEKLDFRKAILFLVVISLAILAFFLIKPLFVSILAGLLLAYLFAPVYHYLKQKTKNRFASAFSTTLLAISLILVPLWLIVPLLIKQAFELFKLVQGLDIDKIINLILPTTSKEFSIQVANAVNSFVSEVSASFLNFLVNFIVEIPTIVLNLFVISLVMFFVFKDGDQFKHFILELSPFSKKHEDYVIERFKSITDALIKGQIIVGVIQGIFAGLGYFVFGVDNALLLTMFSVIFSIIPFVGPSLVWIPVTLNLYLNSTMLMAILFLAYNIIIVSTIDNFLRAYIVSRTARVPQLLVLLGVIGGVLAFGLLGIVLGPLILVYLIMLIEVLRDEKFSSIIKSEEIKQVSVP